MKRINVEKHADSLVPAGKNWKLVWHDEFDGRELDQSKWGFRLNFWGKPFAAFTSDGVELDGDSHLRLHLLNKDGQFCSAQLQTASLTYDIPKENGAFWPFGKYQETKFLHKYGYYEICCKLNRQPGWWCAFWLQSPSIGAHPDPRQCGVECDIMESQDYPDQNLVRCGNIWNGYGHNCQNSGHVKYSLQKTNDDWHRFGVEWNRNGYIFYTDGNEVNRINGPVSNTEQFLLVSTESMGYRQGKPDPRLREITFPEYFEVDYVRVFDEIQ